LNREQALRFEAEFMPRIVEHVARQIGRGLRIDVVPYEHRNAPTRLHISAPPHDNGERARQYPFDLSVFLTWDDDEIERLLRPGGETRFQRYLDSLGAKFIAWQGAREVDFNTRSQAEPSILLGGLDFEP
jgi:hypothetical protein